VRAVKGGAERERDSRAFAPDVGPSRVADHKAGDAFFRAADRLAE
jgi:hypothetical protein